MLTSQNLIYLVTCLIDGKKYVGQTQRLLEIRWKEHCDASRRGKTYHLASAIRKHGLDNFEIKILEICDTPTLMFEREEFWIMELQTIVSGYNKSPGKVGNPTHVITESTREKLSKIRKGKKHADETKQKISTSKKTKPTQFTQEYRDAARARALGRKHTEESKQKMSVVQTGRIVSDETKEKLSKACKGQARAAGHVCTPEMRQRMSDAHKGVTQSKEQRLKRATVVAQCDDNWNLLAVYESQKLAAQLNHTKNDSTAGISACCTLKSAYCCMCRWRHATNDDIEYAHIHDLFNKAPTNIQAIKYKRRSPQK